jgi:hypothetical protein
VARGALLTPGCAQFTVFALIGLDACGARRIGIA